MAGAPRYALVVGRFYEELADRLVDGAREALAQAGVDDVDVLDVPGAFELPLGASYAARSGRYQGVVCLGAVIRGETSHYDHVCAEAARGIQDVQLRTGVPCGFGVLTVETMDQALARLGDKRHQGRDAAQAALLMVRSRAQIGSLPAPSGEVPEHRVHAVGPSSIERVIDRMEAIGRALPAQDGVARFNDLYLAVTREVAAQAGADRFEDGPFLARLDVVFAGVYFEAVEAEEATEPVAHAWEPLFEARGRPKVAPIQFALAGMNAHINHDLCLALVETFLEAGLQPTRGTPQHRDYLMVNELLERVQEQVKERFATGLIGVADEALGRLDDLVAIWSVARARDAAWTHAEALWALRPLPELTREYRETLARIVELAGRGLLTPTL